MGNAFAGTANATMWVSPGWKGGEVEVSMRKGTLFHKTPGWVPTGSPFHIRLRVDRGISFLLTDPVLAMDIIAAAGRYHVDRRWYLKLMVVMPDHIHMIACFPVEPGMSRVVGNWKAYLARHHGIRWQANYFDHRLRNDDEYVEKAHYIRMNPVRAGLCQSPEEWKWVLDRSCLGDSQGMHSPCG
jgi:REP element-mobilizing transposase RayT